MVCVSCGKESKNLRVCPFCFTPYPAQAAQQRQTRRVEAAGSLAGQLTSRAKSIYGAGRAFAMRQTPLVRWSGAGIIIVLILWVATGGGQREFEVGVVQSDIIATPLQRDEAIALIRQTREQALVDIQSDEVFVSYPAATFPVQEAGQLALVQQFTEADEIVEGRKRRIFFYNPNGKLFAQSDGVRGVVLVR
jgi:hypothetical protein